MTFQRSECQKKLWKYTRSNLPDRVVRTGFSTIWLIDPSMSDYNLLRPILLFLMLCIPTHVLLKVQCSPLSFHPLFLMMVGTITSHVLWPNMRMTLVWLAESQTMTTVNIGQKWVGLLKGAIKTILNLTLVKQDKCWLNLDVIENKRYPRSSANQGSWGAEGWFIQESWCHSGFWNFNWKENTNAIIRKLRRHALVCIV